MKEKIAISDRVALAFLSVVVGFLTAVILWLALVGLNSVFTPVVRIPFSIVWWFTGICAMLGGLTMQNLLLAVFERLWKFVHALWSV